MITREKIISAYIEKLALKETQYQFCSRFGFEANLDDMRKNIDKQIYEVDLILNKNPALTAEVILEYRETIKNYNDDRQKNRPSNQDVIK